MGDDWKHRAEFAEEAEALSLTTSHVLATTEARVVTYIANADSNDPDEPLLVAVLVRERELGVFKVLLRDLPSGSLGAFLEVARARLEETLGSD